MKKILLLTLFLLYSSNSMAAYTASAVMEMRSTGSSNLNSGVFDAGVASPGTDYTQQDASQYNSTDLASLTGTTNPCTVTSVAHVFDSNDPGNTILISAGTNWTVSNYVIVSVAAGIATLDKACGTSATLTNGTWRLGGAYPLGNTTAGIGDDARLELLVGGNIIYMKLGTYTQGAAGVSISTGIGTKTAPIYLIGYNSTRTDKPTGTNRPVWNFSSQTLTLGAYTFLSNIITTGTAVAGCQLGAGGTAYNSKFLNTSTTAGRNAVTVSGGDSYLMNNEFVSQNGNAISAANREVIIGNYINDYDVGWLHTNTSSGVFQNNIIESIKSSGISISATSGIVDINSNTIYGSLAQIGTGLLMGASTGDTKITNNIFYGWTTGISQTTAALKSNLGYYNDFFNNGTDVTNYTKDATDIALNPTFTGASQLTGATATTSGSVLTQSGGDFSTVTDNIDYLRVVSGTGVTTGIYLITSHTSTTITVNNALGTSSGGDVVWVVPVGHNFAVGTNLKATGYPGAFNSNTSETTGYLDIGAVQRQETSSSSSTGFFIQ